MAKKIKLKIITPEGIVSSTEEKKVSLKGEKGILELLPNHENYIGILKEGVVSIEKNKQLSNYFITSKALFNFDNTSNSCEIIADFAMSVSAAKNFKAEDLQKLMSNSRYEEKKLFYNAIQNYLIDNT